MALYAVRNKATDKIRLVDAPTNSAALRHVAGDEFAVTIPKPREVAKLVADGVKVEDYGEQRSCARCQSPDVVTNLDGDDLCQKHASEWAKAEGRALAEREAEADDHPGNEGAD